MNDTVHHAYYTDGTPGYPVIFEGPESNSYAVGIIDGFRYAITVKLTYSISLTYSTWEYDIRINGALTACGTSFSSGEARRHALQALGEYCEQRRKTKAALAPKDLREFFKGYRAGYAMALADLQHDIINLIGERRLGNAG